MFSAVRIQCHQHRWRVLGDGTLESFYSIPSKKFFCRLFCLPMLKSQDEKNKKILHELLQREGNKTCFDCKMRVRLLALFLMRQKKLIAWKWKGIYSLHWTHNRARYTPSLILEFLSALLAVVYSKPYFFISFISFSSFLFISLFSLIFFCFLLSVLITCSVANFLIVLNRFQWLALNLMR